MWVVILFTKRVFHPPEYSIINPFKVEIVLLKRPVWLFIGTLRECSLREKPTIEKEICIHISFDPNMWLDQMIESNIVRKVNICLIMRRNKIKQSCYRVVKLIITRALTVMIRTCYPHTEVNQQICMHAILFVFENLPLPCAFS